MKFKNRSQCDGWIEPNLNVSLSFGGQQPFNSVACNYRAHVVYKNLRLCGACMRDLNRR